MMKKKIPNAFLATRTAVGQVIYWGHVITYLTVFFTDFLTTAPRLVTESELFISPLFSPQHRGQSQMRRCLSHRFSHRSTAVSHRCGDVYLTTFLTAEPRFSYHFSYHRTTVFLPLFSPLFPNRTAVSHRCGDVHRGPAEPQPASHPVQCP